MWLDAKTFPPAEHVIACLGRRAVVVA